MNKLIRWGIWGTGAIAHLVANDFRLLNGAVLHAVGSRTLERARVFASQHGSRRYYADLNTLLRDPDIDAVYVASPNHCHVDDSLSCIQAGKALLCEKPFALNLDQAQQLVDEARKHKVFCMEAMWTRFIPGVVEAKRRIASGAIGSIRMIHGNFAYPVLPGPVSSRFFDVERGGGALLDRGVYLISLTQHLLGEPRSIDGMACLGATGVDEQSGYQLTYADGALVSLAASLSVRGSNEFVIFGDGGRLQLCDPFYRTHRLVLTSHAQKGQSAQKVSQPNHPGVRRIIEAGRDSSTVKWLLRCSSPLPEFYKSGKVSRFPFAGNGYQFQFMEVNRCLREHRYESTIMPLDDSLGVMRTMDIIRAQWGLARPRASAE